jgi:hypothetical protein
MRTTEPTNVAKDLAELFGDADPQTRLEALRIRTKHLRLLAWAAIFSAVCGGLGGLRLYFLWRYGA